jgi:hypothetical protein
MKKIILVAFLMVGYSGLAQKNDTLAIKETVLNYIEGYYKADQKRMQKALHPELAKRIVFKDSTGSMVRNMSASELIFSTGKNKNANVLNPDKPFSADIRIYDIFNKVASVKVTTNKFKFIDYLHLAKVEGEWKIINVLWELL